MKNQNNYVIFLILIISLLINLVTNFHYMKMSYLNMSSSSTNTSKTYELDLVTPEMDFSIDTYTELMQIRIGDSISALENVISNDITLNKFEDNIEIITSDKEYIYFHYDTQSKMITNIDISKNQNNEALLLKPGTPTIEDYYVFDENFVNDFYPLLTLEIDYSKIELNYDAYPQLEQSMDISIINIDIDNVEDTRPILMEHISTLINMGVSSVNLDDLTNEDYTNFMSNHKISSEKIYDFTTEEIKFFSDRNITNDDGLFLLHHFRTIEEIKKLTDAEIKEILISEYLFKQLKCKQYLAEYAIFKIYGLRI